MSGGYGIDVIGGPSWPSSGNIAIGSIQWTEAPSRNLPSLSDARDGDDWRLEYDEDRFWVSLEGGASYMVELPDDGAATVTAVLEGWPLEKASLFFILGLLPLALPRFGLTPLHGAAYSTDGVTACLVMGDSGTGKSTTLATQISRGATFLADDACAIDQRGSLWPAPPYWASRDEPSGADHDYIGKAVHRAERTADGPLDVGCTIVLRPEPGSALGVERLPAQESLLAAIANQRSPWLFTSRDEQARRLTATTAVAGRPVGLARYDQDRHEPGELVDAIDAWSGSLSHPTPTSSVQ